MNTTDNRTMIDMDVEQHSLVQSIGLHLLPGVLILVFFVIAAPLAERMKAPPLLVFLLAIAFVLIPFQLVQLGGNPLAVICSQGIPSAGSGQAVGSPSEASFLPFYSQFSPCKAGICRSLASVGN